MEDATHNPVLVLSLGISQSQGKSMKTCTKTQMKMCDILISVFSCLSTLPVWRLFNKLLAILIKAKTYVSWDFYIFVLEYLSILLDLLKYMWNIIHQNGHCRSINTMTQGMIQFINTTSYLSAMVAVAFKYFPFTNFTFEPVEIGFFPQFSFVEWRKSRDCWGLGCRNPVFGL